MRWSPCSTRWFQQCRRASNPTCTAPAESPAPSAVTAPSPSASSQSREPLPATHAPGTATRRHTGSAVHPAPPPLCSSLRECAAPALQQRSSTFLLPSALKQLQANRVFIEFLHQLQSRRRMQIRIVLRRFAAPQNRRKVIVDDCPTIPRGYLQIRHRDIARHSQPPRQPISKSLVTNVYRNRSRTGVLVQPA